MKRNALLFSCILFLPLMLNCKQSRSAPITRTALITTDSISITKSPLSFDSTIVIDIDGNVYHTVTIGTQTWTAENLRTMTYNNGTKIAHVVSDSVWFSCENSKAAAYCYLNNTTNADSIKKFGALYNWYAVRTWKLAPIGWHIPSDAEWDTLQNYLISHGYNYDNTKKGNMIAKAMAAKTQWGIKFPPGSVVSSTICGNIDDRGNIENDLTTNNSSGFSAYPSGFRWVGENPLLHIVNSCYWWSSTESNVSSVCIRWLCSIRPDLVRHTDGFKGCGYSVRLVKD